MALAEELNELDALDGGFDALAAGEVLALEPLLRLISRQRATDVEAPLVHLERLPARAARTAELARPLPPAVRELLGVDAFWSHQAEAIDHVRDGRSVVVATGTASGKSLCYQAPIAEAVATGLPGRTSLTQSNRNSPTTCCQATRA